MLDTSGLCVFQSSGDLLGPDCLPSSSSSPDSELDLVALAEGFGLPHLPHMPELKRADTSAFVPHSTPPSLIPFKNKTREKARQAKLTREGES